MDGVHRNMNTNHSDPRQQNSTGQPEMAVGNSQPVASGRSTATPNNLQYNQMNQSPTQQSMMYQMMMSPPQQTSLTIAERDLSRSRGLTDSLMGSTHSPASSHSFTSSNSAWNKYVPQRGRIPSGNTQNNYTDNNRDNYYAPNAQSNSQLGTVPQSPYYQQNAYDAYRSSHYPQQSSYPASTTVPSNDASWNQNMAPCHSCEHKLDRIERKLDLLLSRFTDQSFNWFPESGRPTAGMNANSSGPSGYSSSSNRGYINSPNQDPGRWTHLHNKTSHLSGSATHGSNSNQMSNITTPQSQQQQVGAANLPVNPSVQIIQNAASQQPYTAAQQLYTAVAGGAPNQIVANQSAPVHPMRLSAPAQNKNAKTPNTGKESGKPDKNASLQTSTNLQNTFQMDTGGKGGPPTQDVGRTQPGQQKGVTYSISGVQAAASQKKLNKDIVPSKNNVAIPAANKTNSSAPEKDSSTKVRSNVTTTRKKKSTQELQSQSVQTDPEMTDDEGARPDAVSRPKEQTDSSKKIEGNPNGDGNMSDDDTESLELNDEDFVKLAETNEALESAKGLFLGDEKVVEEAKSATDDNDQFWQDNPPNKIAEEVAVGTVEGGIVSGKVVKHSSRQRRQISRYSPYKEQEQVTQTATGRRKRGRKPRKVNVQITEKSEVKAVLDTVAPEEGESPKKVQYRKRITIPNPYSSTLKNSAILELCQRFPSHTSFAPAIVRELFTKNERFESNCSGVKGKKRFDPKRLEFVQNITLHLFGKRKSEEQLAKMWRECEIKINRSAHDLRKRARKSYISGLTVAPPPEHLPIKPSHIVFKGRDTKQDEVAE